MKMPAEVTRRGIFDMQVCVPDDWGDAQVQAFAEGENPCGTQGGWIVRDGSPNGDPKEVKCEDRDGHKHVMLDA